MKRMKGAMGLMGRMGRLDRYSLLVKYLLVPYILYVPFFMRGAPVPTAETWFIELSSLSSFVTCEGVSEEKLLEMRSLDKWEPNSVC